MSGIAYPQKEVRLCPAFRINESYKPMMVTQAFPHSSLQNVFNQNKKLQMNSFFFCWFNQMNSFFHCWFIRPEKPFGPCLCSFCKAFHKLYTANIHAKSLQSCLTLCYPMDCILPGSSVHGILRGQAILEWVPMPSSRESSWPRDWTCISYVSCFGREVLYH